MANWMVPIPNAPLQNYAAYTGVVSDLAARAEAVPGRPVVADTDITRQSYLVSEAAVGAPAYPAARQAAMVDGDGDTVMINRIVAAIRATQVGPRNGRGRNAGRGGGGRNDHLPRAPWRPDVEYQAMVARGVCTRCGQNGHIPRDCTTMRAPLRVAQVEVVDNAAVNENAAAGNV